MKTKLAKHQRVVMAFERDLRSVIDKHRGSGVLRVSVLGMLDMIKHELLRELEAAE